MGYVLPVDRYQYTDYQTRAISDKREEMKTNPAFKVVLERHHQEVASNYNRLQLNSKKIETAESRYESAKERIYAEVTGKGQLISEEV